VSTQKAIFQLVTPKFLPIIAPWAYAQYKSLWEAPRIAQRHSPAPNKERPGKVYVRELRYDLGFF